MDRAPLWLLVLMPARLFNFSAMIFAADSRLRPRTAIPAAVLPCSSRSRPDCC
jgi:hypothetical protein